MKTTLPGVPLALIAALALSGSAAAAPDSKSNALPRASDAERVSAMTPPPDVGAAEDTTATAAQPSAFATFEKQTIQRWFELDPAAAVYQGDHRFDGQLPDWSEAGLATRAAFLHSVIDQAGAFTGLSPQDALERDALVQLARKNVFWLVTADWPHKNPHWYIDNGLDPNTYLAREYADKPTRMKALIAFFRAIPKAAGEIRANLKTPMPLSYVDSGIASFGGFADFYRGDAPKVFADVQDPALQAQLRQSSEAAASAMDALTTWFKAQKLRATQGFAMGADQFSGMLRETEAVDIPLDTLEQAGRADLARNQAALKDACAQYAPGKTVLECTAKANADKPEGGPVAAARRFIPELTAFVREKDLLTIPGTEQALVEESPPYNRQNGAYIDPPGPLDKGIPSVYYISPPDPSWSKEKQLAYIPSKSVLLITTAHEVMPGHFLQFLHSNRAPSLVGSLFVGYAYAEGWAHYSEEMIWEAGYGNGDPEIHIGQLSDALLRNCRFISAIGLHARGMTQAQSEAMFEHECYQDPGNAEQQAARGTYDPAYLNYTLGKLMIRKLRTDWTASRGGRKAWKAFHDQFLSYGGLPIPLVRQAMMGEPEPKAVF
jgi:hypothetical protein